MPRTAKTDPADSPCWVEGCNNVGGKYRVCDPHLRQVMPPDAGMRRMMESFDVNLRLRSKHTREVLAAARKAGLKIVERPAYAEADRQAALARPAPPS